MGPSKIGDFSVRLLADTRSLHATWTATDDDVDSYKLVFAEDVQILLKNDFPAVLHSFEPGEPKLGAEKSISFELPQNFFHYDRDLYVAIYGVDGESNKGKISNLVYLRVPGLSNSAEDKNAEGSDGSGLLTGVSADLDWIVIGIIGGVVGVLLLLSVVALVYYCAVARRRRGNKAKSGKAGSTTSMMNGGGSSDETDASSFDSDIKNIMAMPHQTTTNVATMTKGHIVMGGSSVDSGVSSNSSGDTPT